MADVKISGLPASTTPLAGTEVLPIVQGGQTRQVSVANLTAGRAVSATDLTLTGVATVPAGTVSAPSITTTGDTNTGIFFPAADTIAFVEGGVEAMRINSSGGVQNLNTISVGAATPSTSGAGITFPATQSASTNANTLDDYEEGTWTPVLRFGGTSTGITYIAGYQNGLYTKVGNLVTLTAAIYLSNKGTDVGVATIAGLPFNGANTDGVQGAAGLYIDNVSFTAYPSLSNVKNATRLDLNQTSTAGTPTSLTNTQFANNSYIQFTISYRVA